MTKHNIQYLVGLIEKHGFDILRTTKNKEYPKQLKEDTINRALIDNEPIKTVAIDIGLLSDGMLLQLLGFSSVFLESFFN